MILSVSRRTDIPAFFSDWFYNRIEKGFVLVRNPMNTHQISKINITPEIVDCFVFWTKNPKYFIERLHLLYKYNFYFQYTITGYGKEMERNVPNLNDSLETFRKLSNQIGSYRVIWRYDPIILTDIFDINFHIYNFEIIAKKLSGYTNKCVISFVDFYKKTIKNLSHVKYSAISPDQIYHLSRNLKRIGEQNGIVISSCAEEIDLSELGIEHGKCIDDKLIEEIMGVSLKSEKDKNQRAECGCIASIDIGAYNTCLNECLYCYANYDTIQVKKNYSQHDKYSDLLFGTISQTDKITERKIRSCKIQKSLFDIF